MPNSPVGSCECAELENAAQVLLAAWLDAPISVGAKRYERRGDSARRFEDLLRGVRRSGAVLPETTQRVVDLVYEARVPVRVIREVGDDLRDPAAGARRLNRVIAAVRAVDRDTGYPDATGRFCVPMTERSVKGGYPLSAKVFFADPKNIEQLQSARNTVLFASRDGPRSGAPSLVDAA